MHRYLIAASRRPGRPECNREYPVDRRPFWLARARHEIAVYDALSALARLPVTVPELVAADPVHHLLVVTHLVGRPVHPHRYFTGTIHNGQIDDALNLLNRVHSWRPAPPSVLPYDDDYPSQLSAVRGTEINDIEYHRAIELYTAVADRTGVEVQHGDAHLGNVISLPDGQLALIDLEFTAWRLPGYDLAMLWVLLGNVAGVREHLLQRVGASIERHAAFWCSTVLVCLREITSHQREPRDPAHANRLERLHHDLALALSHVRAYHRQIG